MVDNQVQQPVQAARKVQTLQEAEQLKATLKAREAELRAQLSQASPEQRLRLRKTQVGSELRAIVAARTQLREREKNIRQATIRGTTPQAERERQQRTTARERAESFRRGDLRGFEADKVTRRAVARTVQAEQLRLRGRTSSPVQEGSLTENILEQRDGRFTESSNEFEGRVEQVRGEDFFLGVRPIGALEQESRTRSIRESRDSVVDNLFSGILPSVGAEEESPNTKPEKKGLGLPDATTDILKERTGGVFTFLVGGERAKKNLKGELEPTEFDKGFTEAFNIESREGFIGQFDPERRRIAERDREFISSDERGELTTSRKSGQFVGRAFSLFPLTQIAFGSGELGQLFDVELRSKGREKSGEQALLESRRGQEIFALGKAAEDQAVSDNIPGTQTISRFLGEGADARREATFNALEKEFGSEEAVRLLPVFERQRRFRVGGTVGGLITQEVSGEIIGGGILLTGGRALRRTSKAKQFGLSSAAGGFVEGGGAAQFLALQEGRGATPREFGFGAGAGAATAGLFGFGIGRRVQKGKSPQRLITLGRIVDPLETPGDIIGGAILKAGRSRRVRRPRVVSTSGSDIAAVSAIQPGERLAPAPFSVPTIGTAPTPSTTPSNALTKASAQETSVFPSTTSSSTFSFTPSTTSAFIPGIVPSSTSATTPATTPATSISATPAITPTIAPQFRFLPPLLPIPRSGGGFSFRGGRRSKGIKIDFAPGIAARALNIRSPKISDFAVGTGLSFRPIVAPAPSRKKKRRKKARKKKKR